MIQHDDVTSSRLFLFRQKGAAQGQLYTEQREKASSNAATLDLLGLAHTRQVESQVGPIDGGDKVKDLVFIAVLKKYRPDRGLVEAGLQEVPLNQHEPLGIFVRQWAKQNSIDDAENGGICTDSESQREHRNSRKSWALKQGADAVAEISDEGIHWLHLFVPKSNHWIDFGRTSGGNVAG
jgi:hypothetical protein